MTSWEANILMQCTAEHHANLSHQHSISRQTLIWQINQCIVTFVSVFSHNKQLLSGGSSQLVSVITKSAGPAEVSQQVLANMRFFLSICIFFSFYRCSQRGNIVFAQAAQILISQSIDFIFPLTKNEAIRPYHVNRQPSRGKKTLTLAVVC